jgi:predicted dehydrogenase
VRPLVGLIGAGNIGGFHSRSLRGITRMGLVDAQYVAVCDQQPELAGEFARLAGLEFWTADPNELIASPKINTVYVCTPTGEHAALVAKAAALGKHVFCEKPLGRSLDEARAMYGTVRAAGVRHQVGLILRHSPIFTVLKDLLSDPKLGRLMAVIFRDDQFFPIQGHYRSSWRKDFATTGGGTLIEHSIHDLDILTSLCGDVASLRAQTRNFAGHEGIEDFAAVTINFANGATAQLTSVWHNVLSRGSTRYLEVFCEHGYFSIDQDFLGDLRYETYATDGRAVMPQDDVLRRYLDLIDLPYEEFAEAARRWSLEDYFFLRALVEERDPYPGFDVALRAHEIVDAVYRSAADGGAVVSLTS